MGRLTSLPFWISKEPFCACVVRKVSVTSRMRNTWSLIPDKIFYLGFSVRGGENSCLAWGHLIFCFLTPASSEQFLWAARLSPSYSSHLGLWMKNAACYISKQRKLRLTSHQPLQMPQTVHPEGIQDGESRILAPDSWGACQNNDFNKPRLSHLLNSLTWGDWFFFNEQWPFDIPTLLFFGS